MSEEEFRSNYFATREAIASFERYRDQLVSEFPTQFKGKAIELIQMVKLIDSMYSKIDKLHQERNKIGHNQPVSNTGEITESETARFGSGVLASETWTLQYGTNPVGSIQRFPMTIHKNALMTYLNAKPFAHRHEILKDTKIPSATLTELLKDPVFVQIKRGIYSLGEKENEAIALVYRDDVFGHFVFNEASTFETICKETGLSEEIVSVVLGTDEFCEMSGGWWTVKTLGASTKSPCDPDAQDDQGRPLSAKFTDASMAALKKTIDESGVLKPKK